MNLSYSDGEQDFSSTCWNRTSSLRTMFAWVHKVIGEPDSALAPYLAGRRSDVTKAQICALPA